MRDIIARHVETVLPLLNGVRGQPGGILPSEMLAYVCVCREQKVATVVESGRKFGYSTECLCRGLPDCRIVSLEQSPIPEAEERLKVYSNLTLLQGDGLRMLPRLASGAVLLDGPKGQKAVDLVGKVRAQISFAAIHDLCPTHSARHALSERGEDVWYTDDAEYVQEYGYLDQFYVTNGGYTSREEMVREGFSLGFLRGGLWK